MVGNSTLFAYSTALNSQAFDVWRINHGYEFSLPDGNLLRQKVST